ncbi:MAG: L-fucose/L-arabinose isomerase family protein [Bacteroidales bacterium]|nr:L-fucose/L-arabinose isomerase family protein [Bacteroidales bacterium]
MKLIRWKFLVFPILLTGIFIKGLDAQPDIPRKEPLSARVGIYGVGHYTYWDQFPGLLDRMHEKMDVFEEKVKSNGVEVVNFGLGDKAKDAYRVLPEMQAANLDLLFIDMVTYATSSTIAKIFRDLDVPMVMVGLQPLEALDYDKATTQMQLANDDICSMPEFANTAVRMGREVPPFIIGTLHNDPEADKEIAKYCQIAKVLHDLKTSRIGAMGHVLENMYDLQFDPTQISEAFGCHVVMCEANDIVAKYQKVSEKEVEDYKERVLSFFDTPVPKADPITQKLTDKDLYEASKTGVALEKFIEEKDLDGLSYYYEGMEGSETQKVMSSLIVGNSLLTAAGFPMVGEFDIKTCISMMIMDRLDIGGSLGEFHPIDFKEDFVLVGHDGPHHIKIAEGKPVIRSLKKYHGKPGSGASVEFKIKEGPITLMGIGQTKEGDYKFIIAEGRSEEGPIPATGNTNTRGKFFPDTKTFLKRWFSEAPTHHFAIGVGHHADELEQIAEYLDIKSVVVTPPTDNK